MSKAGRPRERWVVAGIDIGHGETKWASEWGRGHHKSVVARDPGGVRHEVGVQGAVKKERFIIENGIQRGGMPTRFGVGDYAYTVGVPAQALDIGRLDDETYTVLINAALARAVKSSGPVIYVTGLPVDYLNKKDKLRTILADENGKRWTVYLVEPLEQGEDGNYYYDLYPEWVFILPEGLGGVMSLYLTDAGKVNPTWAYLDSKTVGVVDIGTLSTDVSTFDPGFAYNENKTATMRLGLGTVYDLIIREVKQREGMVIDRQQAEAALKTRKLKVGKETKDVGAWVDAAIEDVAARIVGELRGIWQSGFDIEVLLLLGGGADYMVAAIMTALEKTEVIPVPDAPMANALGYYRYGMYKLSRYLHQQEALEQSAG